MFMVLSSWQSHCESSPGSFDECRTAPSGRQPRLVAMSQARRLRLRVRLYSLLESTPTIAIYYNYSARKLDRQKSLHIANDRRQPDSYNGRLRRREKNRHNLILRIGKFEAEVTNNITRSTQPPSVER